MIFNFFKKVLIILDAPTVFKKHISNWEKRAIVTRVPKE
jgi:hypothetical protein